MDQEVEIKQEPVLHEGTAYTLFDIYEHVPEKRHLKEEIKSEFAEPGRTQDNYELVSEKTLLKEGTKSELVETGQTQVNTFEDNYKLESEKTHLKEEIKSELVEPGQTQVDTFEDGDEHESGKTPFKEEIKSELSEPERTQPFRDIKDELFVEEHALGELVPCFKEENVENEAVLTRGPVRFCQVCCQSLKINKMMCHLPTRAGERADHCIICRKQLFSHCREWTTDFEENDRQLYLLPNIRREALSQFSLSLYKCNECGRTFSRKRNLQRHTLIHSGVRRHVCNECGRMFSIKSNLKTHMLTHSNERPHSCSKCTRRFSRKADLIRHMLIHTGERQRPSYKCGVCGKSFYRKYVLTKHQLSHSVRQPDRSNDCVSTLSKKCTCNVCGKSFYQKSYLASHMLSHSGVKPNNGLGSVLSASVHTLCRAENLNKSSHFFPLPVKSQFRVQVKSEFFRCNECSFTFSRKYHLQRHMLTHSRERAYLCHECGSLFSMKSNLEIHMLTHSRERAHCCSDCGRKFSRNPDLLRHKLTHGERPRLCYKCDVCGETFYRKYLLTKHLLSHSQGQPDRSNDSVPTLPLNSTRNNIHVLRSTHQSLKQCRNLFSFSVKSHLRKPHVCIECGRIFFRRYHLMRHMLTHSKKR